MLLDLNQKEVEAADLMRSWLTGKGREFLTGFSKRCGTSLGNLRQIAYRGRRCPPELAVQLDRESGGELNMKVMCPSQIDWKYLETKLTGDTKRATKKRIGKAA